MGTKLSSESSFFNAMLIGTAMFVVGTAAFEYRKLPDAWAQLQADGLTTTFVQHLALSAVGFFFYQFAQMVLMSKMSAVTISVMTPSTKAFVIICCALYFGETVGLKSLTGLLQLMGGVLMFAIVRRWDTADASMGAPQKKTN